MLHPHLPPQDNLSALLGRSAHPLKSNVRKRHISHGIKFRWNMPILSWVRKGKVSLRIPENICSSQEERRRIPTQSPKAIPRRPRHLLPLQQRRKTPDPSATRSNFNHLSRVRLHRNPRFWPLPHGLRLLRVIHNFQNLVPKSGTKSTTTGTKNTKVWYKKYHTWYKRNLSTWIYSPLSTLSVPRSVDRCPLSASPLNPQLSTLIVKRSSLTSEPQNFRASERDSLSPSSFNVNR